MEIRFELSNVLRNTINKSINGEISLPEFLDEIAFVYKQGRELLKQLPQD